MELLLYFKPLVEQVVLVEGLQVVVQRGLELLDKETMAV